MFGFTFLPGEIDAQEFCKAVNSSLLQTPSTTASRSNCSRANPRARSIIDSPSAQPEMQSLLMGTHLALTHVAIVQQGQ